MRLARSALLTLVACALWATPAQAVPFTFDCISSAADCGTLEDQLLVDVASNGLGQVVFTFSNNVGDASSITDVYFDTESDSLPFTGIASVSGTAGVDFSAGASPGDIPGDFDAVFSADSNPPTAPNGVNSALERLYIVFNLNQAMNQTFASVLAAIGSGDLLIGLHVQAIGVNGTSAWFENNGPPPPDDEPPDDEPPNPVPEPASMLLLGSGLAATAWKARKRKLA